MKKIVAFLIDVMCVFSLTACVKMKNVDYDSFVKSTENTSSEYLQIDSEGASDKESSNTNTVHNCCTISAGGYHTACLRSDGTVDAVGFNSNRQCAVEKWTDITAVSAGFDNTAGLKSDGTAIVIGNNEYGQCDVSDWTNIVDVSSGIWHTAGLRSDGTVIAVGDNEFVQCDLYNWIDIRVP